MDTELQKDVLEDYRTFINNSEQISDAYILSVWESSIDMCKELREAEETMAKALEGSGQTYIALSISNGDVRDELRPIVWDKYDNMRDSEGQKLYDVANRFVYKHNSNQ